MSIVERALQKAHGRGTEKPGEARRGPLEPTAPMRNLPPVPHRQLKLDRARLRHEGALPPPDHERQLAEQYRRIKRPLVAYALTTGDSKVASRHVILVASAIPGEGKTFTAINLAISLAQEKDVSVLLIDADIAKPHVTDLFGLRGERGLFDALSDEAVDAESLILDTDIPGLSFLPAGVAHEGTAAELLASHRMNALMSQIVSREARRLIVIDSPPLLLTNESRELVNVAGQIVLVVRSSSTEQQAVIDAVTLIPEGKNVGLILNQVDPESSDVQLYGYGRYGNNYPATPETGS